MLEKIGLLIIAFLVAAVVAFIIFDLYCAYRKRNFDKKAWGNDRCRFRK